MFSLQVVKVDGVQQNSNKNQINIIPVSNKTLDGFDGMKDEIKKMIKNKDICPYITRTAPENLLQLGRFCQDEMLRERKSHSNYIPLVRVTELFEAIKSETKGKSTSSSNESLSSFGTEKELIPASDYINSTQTIIYLSEGNKVAGSVGLDIKWILLLIKALFVHNPKEIFQYSQEFKKVLPDEEVFNSYKEEIKIY